MAITLDGLSFDVTDFVGTDGLGHAETLPSATGASGASYPAEARFPNRVFRAGLNEFLTSTTAASASAAAALASENAAAASELAAAASETAAAASAAKLSGTSTTSVAIGTGSKSFTTQSGKFFEAGRYVMITSDAAPATNNMFGQVTAYSGGSLTVDVLATKGSGTYADWTISLAGARGATGATGPAGPGSSVYFDDDGGTPSIAPSATGTDSIAIGDGAVASATNAYALGTNASASVANSVAIGKSATVASNGSVAIGNTAGSSGQKCIAIGDNAYANSNDYAIAIGYSGQALGARSVSIGQSVQGGPNIAHADSIGLGNMNLSRNIGQFVVGTGRFSANGDSQYSRHLLRGSTTNSTPTEIFCNGTASARISIPSDSTFLFRAYIVARRTDADNESAGYVLTGLIDNNSGTTALVNSVTSDYTNEDTAAWSVALTADNTNDALILTVTGENSKTIRWVAMVETVEVVG